MRIRVKAYVALSAVFYASHFVSCFGAELGTPFLTHAGAHRIWLIFPHVLLIGLLIARHLADLTSRERASKQWHEQQKAAKDKHGSDLSEL